MKSATMFALIATAIQLIYNIWQLLDLGYMDILYDVIRIGALLSPMGLILFFVQLYKKQSKN